MNSNHLCIQFKGRPSGFLEAVSFSWCTESRHWVRPLSRKQCGKSWIHPAITPIFSFEVSYRLAKIRDKMYRIKVKRFKGVYYRKSNRLQPIAAADLEVY
jgi:hypothetical protein